MSIFSVVILVFSGCTNEKVISLSEYLSSNAGYEPDSDMVFSINRTLEYGGTQITLLEYTLDRTTNKGAIKASLQTIIADGYKEQGTRPLNVPDEYLTAEKQPEYITDGDTTYFYYSFTVTVSGDFEESGWLPLNSAEGVRLTSITFTNPNSNS